MNIASVIVTYNRKNCLNKLLNIYENLSVKPNTVIIVNNNSNDGTKELLDEWLEKDTVYCKYVINTTKNLGGSGGFFEGIKKAQQIGADWIYVSDDDAYPEKNIFNIFKAYIKNNDTKKVAAVCGMVKNNGKIDKSHRRRIKKGIFRIKEVEIMESEYKKNFELDLFSYVGTMLNSSYLKKYGITEKDYFIYYDDTEHSLRLSKYGKIICLPDASICHDVVENLENNVTWKTYYGERNRLMMIKKHYGFRYFIFEYYRVMLIVFKKIIMGKKTEAMLLKKSIEDSRKNIQGIDNVYKPGWSINAYDNK